MQSAVDPDHGLALAGQGVRLRIRQALGQRQPAGNVALVIEVLQVLRRRDDRHPDVAALDALAEADQLHPIALGGQLLPVGGGLVVVGQEIVVPRFGAVERRLGRRDVRRGHGRRLGDGGAGLPHDGQRQAGDEC